MEGHSGRLLTQVLGHCQKSDTEQRLKEWISIAQRECGKKLRKLRSDNGTEVTVGTLRNRLKLKGVKQQFTTPGYPQGNGVAERVNRILADRTRAMMLHAGIVGGSWGKSVKCASYVRNRCLVTGMEKTPQELWTVRKPTIAHLRTFGCKVYAPIDPKHRQGNLGAVRWEGVLVGYSDDSQA